MLSATQDWIHTKCWVACFDILGFKNLVSFEDDESLQITFLVEDYEKTLEHLRTSCEPYQEGDLEYCWLSDTFVLFSRDDSARSYAVLQQAAKHFITECTYSKIPIRGAISVGHITRSNDNRSFMGKAFIDAFIYAEDQDWIGLLLTPTAIEKANSYGLFPERHDFVKSEKIPMRKCLNRGVMAYRFQNGNANFASHMLPMLAQMKYSSAEQHHKKYDGTIHFIEEHYRYIEEHGKKCITRKRVSLIKLLCAKGITMGRSLVISTIVTLIMVPAYQAIYFSRSLDQAHASELGIFGKATDGQIVASGFDYLLSYKNPINYLSDNWSFLVLSILIAFISSILVLRTKKVSCENA